MSVHAMASTVHIGITSGAVASSFFSTTVLTSADHLLRYYCICHTYLLSVVHQLYYWLFKK